MNDSKSTRIQWIDLTRALAIFFVVLCHTITPAYLLIPDFTVALSQKSQLYSLCMFTIGRLGVPLFLMISGYLLLDRTYNKESTIRFWKNNWFHLLICTELWWIIYEAYLYIVNDQQFDLYSSVLNLLFLHNLDLPHTWYMPKILGLYLLIPFVAKGLDKIDSHTLRIPLLISIVYVYGYPLLKIISTVKGWIIPSLQFDVGFTGGTYGIYLISGYYIRKGGLKKIHSAILFLLFTINIILAVLLQFKLINRGNPYYVWYDNLFLFLASVCLFELLSRTKQIKGYKIIGFLSYYSFAIYLLHEIVRMILAPYIETLPLSRFNRHNLIWFLVIVISSIIAFVISKIPKIGKILLYLK